MNAVVTRRTMLSGAAASAAATLLPESLSRAATPLDLLNGSGRVVVCTWGGSYLEAQRSAFFRPFSEATGIEVVTTGTPDAAKLKLMAESHNVEWDLMCAEGQMMYKAARDGLLLPLDAGLLTSIVPRDKLIDGTLVDFGFSADAYGWVLVWNTARFPAGGPRNWADFWDTDKFAGRRALYAEPRPVLEAALLADGVPMDKIYPLDLDRGFKKLDQIRPHVDVWVADTGQYDVLMQNGEVDLMLGTLGRAFLARARGVKVDFTMDGGMWQQSFWVVPKDAPNAGNAQKLIAWMAQADGEAAFIARFPFGMPNKDAYAKIDPAVAASLPTAPGNLPKELEIDSHWWADNLDAVNRRWLEWYSIP